MEFCSTEEYQELLAHSEKANVGVQLYLAAVLKKLSESQKNNSTSSSYFSQSVSYINDLLGTPVELAQKFLGYCKGNREQAIDMILSGHVPEKDKNQWDDLTQTLLMQASELEDELIRLEAKLVLTSIQTKNFSNIDSIELENNYIAKSLREARESKNVHFFCQHEKEILKGNQIKRWMFYPQNFFDLEAEQIHFRIAESQFHRFLSSQGYTQYRLSQVEYIVNPDIVRKFKESKTKLAKRHGFLEESMKPIYMFHGTSEQNMESIIKTNFLISKVGSSTDAGFYGRGIYFSEYPTMSISYSRGNPWILLCAVYVGKAFKMSQIKMGCALEEGYDSHIASSGQEVIIFDTDCILPCYKIKYGATTNQTPTVPYGIGEDYYKKQ